MNIALNNPRKMADNIGQFLGYLIGSVAALKLFWMGDIHIDWDAVFKIAGSLILAFAGGMAAKAGGYITEYFMKAKAKTKQLFKKKKS